MAAHRASASCRTAGFTVIELAISLAVTVIILLAVLQLFDFASRISKVQTNVADLQQSQRVAHYETTRLIRMAGRGGLQSGNMPAGIALSVLNNVASGTRIGGPGTPPVVQDTDILTIRGVLTAAVLRVAFGDQTAFTLAGPAGARSSGTVRIDKSVWGVGQDLTAITDAITQRRPEALIIVGFPDPKTFAVVELNPALSVVNPTNVVVAFNITGGTNAAAYSTLNSTGPGVFPSSMTKVSRVGILEEYRFYLHEDLAVPADPSSELIRRLSRARTYPATNLPYAADVTNWQQDIADNVLDFQVALGLNTPNGGCAITPATPNCTISESANGTNDDWLFNAGADTAPFAAGTWAGQPLYYVRLSTLVRTDRRDKVYTAPVIAHIEDHDYSLAPASLQNTDTTNRMFRRRVLQTVIDLRNL
jgi:hypothetical protein